MKKLLFSVAAVTILTAAFLITFWTICSTNDIPSGTTEHYSSEESHISSFLSEDPTSESKEVDTNLRLGPLFSPVKDLIDGGVYKLITVRQKRFGGNSVPVKTTTYYGDGFINVIEEEGHGISTETFIDESGTYCFDSTSNTVYLMSTLQISLDSIITNELVYLETGTATVGTTDMTYERYKTEDGVVIDYLFAGKDIKKMKIYSDDDYELISVEISSDISYARTSIPNDAHIITNG